MKTQVVNTTPFTWNAGRILAAKVMLIAVYSFFICRAALLGSMAPFGIAFTAVMPMQYAWVTFLGSLLGYGTLGFSANNLLYITTLGLVMIFKLLMEKSRLRKNWVVLGTMVLFANLVVSFIAAILLHLEPMQVALRVCESVLAAGVTCFFHFAVEAVLHKQGMRTYSQTELASCAIVLMLGIIALMDIQFGVFSLGIIAGVVCLYIMIYKLGAVGGAVSAVVLGIAFNLYRMEYINLCVLLVLASLAAGLFRPLGRMMQVGVFLSVSVFSMFILGVSLNMLYHMVEVVIASGIFLMLRKHQLNRIAFAGLHPQMDQNLRTNIEHRLDFAACTIVDLQDSLQQVSERLKESADGDIVGVYQKTVSAVCKNCTMRNFCWNEHYEQAVDTFIQLTDTLKAGKPLQKENMDGTQLHNCCKKATLTQQLAKYYNEFLSMEQEKRRLSEMRELAVEQLSGVSQMLWEVSDEISNVQLNDNAAAAVVSDVFTELAVEPTCVYCTINAYDRMEIDIYTTAAAEYHSAELCDLLSQNLRRSFAEPAVSQIDNKVRISFYEKANFAVDFGVCQIAGLQAKPHGDGEGESENIPCGDSYEYFRDNKGNAFLILSDGMGSGPRAELDSAITCSIILKLIKAGFGMDSILKFVNSSLQAKSIDESLSTIDIAKLDLYTGQVEFFKAGSAVSFVSIDGIVGEVKTNSLPAGILQGIEFDKSSLLLNVGDLIVLLSDGVLSATEEELKRAIRESAEIPAQQLADKLCDLAVQAAGENRHDDLTAMVAKIEQGI